MRLLAGDDGVGVATLNVRGAGTIAGPGDGLEGSLSLTWSPAFGQTAATSEGTLGGTPLDGPLLWLTPTGDVAPED